MITNGGEKFFLQAKSATRDLWTPWVPPLRDGVPLIFLPDGRSLGYLIAEGDFSALDGPPVFRAENKGRIGDMLWTTGPFKLVSQAFLDAIESIQATGYTTYPVTLLSRRREPIPGFYGFLTPGDEGCDFTDYSSAPTWRCIANSRVVDALTRAGAANLHIQPLAEEPPPR